MVTKLSMVDVARQRRMLAVSAFALCAMGGAVAADPRPDAQNDVKTETPIKHVIVVIGENRTFDHVFGTYVPNPSQSILNLLSEGIIHANGSSGQNFAAARQFTTGPQTSYYIGVTSPQKTAYSVLPAPTLGGAPNQRARPRRHSPACRRRS
jgi:phospholipase C